MIDKTKKNVFLDLDNTLLSAEALEDFPFDEEGMRDKAINFAIHDMDGYYIVFERPHVQDFLDWLFKNYNVSVWTAASKDYALFIVQEILLKKPNRKLDCILFSYHCDISKDKYGFSKKLSLVFNEFDLDGYNEDNTIIIDDLYEVYESQPDRCINIKGFEILGENSENDTELISIKDKIIEIFEI
jgi:TFIIF-interacting CTD phosphatase-like protein